ncbi:unnamed protein product [Cunninghamella echinulata]
MSTTVSSLEPTSGKRIALPVRIEPKVFFANERTFLSWLNFTVVLGGLAIGLLNFGDCIGKCLLSFLLLLLWVSCYMLYIPSIGELIRFVIENSASYDDRFGPTVLCILMLAAVITNFYLRLGDKK